MLRDCSTADPYAFALAAPKKRAAEDDGAGRTTKAQKTAASPKAKGARGKI